jgi:hypothetical protein
MAPTAKATEVISTSPSGTIGTIPATLATIAAANPSSPRS